MSADQAPAGTKRLSNLLRCTKGDDSVLEKAESIEAEGLCAVRSSKAARLKRIKPGYFNPPGGEHAPDKRAHQ